MKQLILVFALIAFFVSLVATASQETLNPIEYRLGNHNVSFVVSNADEYKVAVEPPIYSPDSKSWTYTLNMTRSTDNDIHINLYEYPSSQSIDLPRKEKSPSLPVLILLVSVATILQILQ